MPRPAPASTVHGCGFELDEASGHSRLEPPHAGLCPGRYNPDLLLAGTTEGLWISEDRGGHWRLATSKELVVNTLLVHEDGRIMLGTEGAGVLESRDGGTTWASSNNGFSERFVSELVFDPARGRLSRPSGETGSTAASSWPTANAACGGAWHVASMDARFSRSPCRDRPLWRARTTVSMRVLG